MNIKYQQNIILPSRYPDEYIMLIPLNENVYKVDFTHNPYSYRIILEDDNKTIKAFDPSGGPFTSVGSFIDDNKFFKVTQIYKDESTKDLLVTLEDIRIC
jgi:hypothetical protein